MYQEKISIIRENIEKKFIGKREVIDNVIIALIAGGHVLLEDVPGVGKTTFAKALSQLHLRHSQHFLKLWRSIRLQ